MIWIRPMIVALVLASSTLLAAGSAEAGLCGFPGAVLAGANALDPFPETGYVVVFTPPLQAGIASVRLTTNYGRACMQMWNDATVLTGPVNFLGLWAPAGGGPIANPTECADLGCGAPLGTYCRRVSLCMAFPK